MREVCPCFHSLVGRRKSLVPSVSKEQDFMFHLLLNLKKVSSQRRSFVSDFMDIGAISTSLDMLIHCGFLVQWDAILVKEDILLLVQQLNDDLCSLVCNLFVSCSEYILYYRRAEQRVVLCRSLFQKSVLVNFEILEWNVDVLQLKLFSKLGNQDCLLYLSFVHL